MSMNLKEYIVKPATGNKLESMLNDMHSEGYDPVENGIQFQGIKEMQNPLMQDQSTMMPLYTVIFRRRIGVDA